MPTQVIMPQLGESVVEGTITRWLKAVGEPVEEYEPLLEVNTDKVDTEVPSPAAVCCWRYWSTRRPLSRLALAGSRSVSRRSNPPRSPSRLSLSRRLPPQPRQSRRSFQQDQACS